MRDLSFLLFALAATLLLGSWMCPVKASRPPLRDGASAAAPVTASVPVADDICTALAIKEMASAEGMIEGGLTRFDTVCLSIDDRDADPALIAGLMRNARRDRRIVPESACPTDAIHVWARHRDLSSDPEAVGTVGMRIRGWEAGGVYRIERKDGVWNVAGTLMQWIT